MSLFRTKPIESLAPADHEGGLKRVLGPGNLIALGIGAIIGTGIFVLTGQAAAAHAGPGDRASRWCSPAWSARWPGCATPSSPRRCRSPGPPTPTRTRRSGEFVAWIIGWDLVLEYALGAATVAVGWSGYLVRCSPMSASRFRPPSAPRRGRCSWRLDGSTVTAIFNLPAVLIAVLVTVLLVRGVRESASVNAVMVIIKVAVVVLVIAAGVWFVDARPLHAARAAQHRDLRRVRLVAA